MEKKRVPQTVGWVLYRGMTFPTQFYIGMIINHEMRIIGFLGDPKDFTEFCGEFLGQIMVTKNHGGF